MLQNLSSAAVVIGTLRVKLKLNVCFFGFFFQNVVRIANIQKQSGSTLKTGFLVPLPI